MSVKFYQTTRHYIPQDCSENLRPIKLFLFIRKCPLRSVSYDYSTVEFPLLSKNIFCLRAVYLTTLSTCSVGAIKWRPAIQKRSQSTGSYNSAQSINILKQYRAPGSCCYNVVIGAVSAAQRGAPQLCSNTET